MKNINEIQRRFKQNAKDEQQTPDRIIQASAGSKGGSSGNSFAVVTTVCPTIENIKYDWSIYAKLSDADGVTTGSDILMPVKIHFGVNALDGEVWPQLTATMIIPVVKIAGEWHIDLQFDDIGC